jgi:carbamoyltransferase
MGLAPYGQPGYAERILSKLVDLKDDGSFRLETKYFDYETGLRMTNRQFDALFEGKARAPEEPLTQRHMDLAASIQVVTEEIVLRLARTVREETGAENLCMAGGVALNCVANGRILREAGFKDVWIQPAAGDAGGAVGAALAGWHQYYDGQRCLDDEGAHDGMNGALLGPRFSNDEARQMLDAMGARHTIMEDAALLPRTASLLDQGNVIGWFSGRMEFGPRALGARSILGDPRNPAMQSTMNLRIKFRESFRPFAPAILLEDASGYFDIDRASPYMLLVAQVRDEFRLPMSEADQNLFGIDRLNVLRSTIPAVTHVDYSARLQTVDSQTNPRFHSLLQEFKNLTGCPVLVNTSFNVRGEPIVCTPADAYRCFMNTEMEYLVIENLLLDKREQSTFLRADRAQYEPD